jgi:antitoxin ParD1/3/4
MTRSSRAITVTLGAYQPKVEARVASGEYASASEVLRAGLRALEDKEQAYTEWLRTKVQEAMEDPGPDLPMDEVFDELEAKLQTMIDQQNEAP